MWLGGSADDAESQRRRQAIRTALQQLGWIDSRNIRLEFRFSTDAAQSRAVASEIAAIAPDVIVAATAPVLAVAHRQTKTIPIVFMQVTDPGQRRVCCQSVAAGRQRDGLHHL